MRNPVQAMVWELWRLTRREFFLRLSFFCLMGLLALFPHYYLSEIERDAAQEMTWLEHPLVGPVVGMSLLVFLLPGACWNSYRRISGGFPFSLGFARPVRTSWLVGVPMVFLTGLTGLTYLISAGLFRMVFGIPIPLVSMVVLAMTIGGTIILAGWCWRSRWARVCSLLFVAGLWWEAWGSWILRQPEILGGAATSREGIPIPLSISTSLSPADYMLLLLVYVLSIIVCIVMVERQRRGDGFGPIVGAKASARRRVASPMRPFSSQNRAQFWFEMRWGWLLILWVSAASAVWAMFVLPLLQERESRGTGAGAWLGAVLMSPLPSMVFASEWLVRLRRRRDVTAPSVFAASQPIGNGRWAFVKFLVFLASVLVGWLTMLGVWSSGWVHGPDCWEMVEVLERDIVAAVPIPRLLAIPMGLYAGAILCAGMAAGLYGLGLRWSKMSYEAGVGVVVGAVYVGVMVGVADTDMGLWWFWLANASAAALGLSFFAVVNLGGCVERGYMSRRVLVLILCLWAPYGAVVLWLAYGLDSISAAGSVFCVGLGRAAACGGGMGAALAGGPPAWMRR